MRQVSDRIRMLRGTGVKTDRADRDRHIARPPLELPKCPPGLSREARAEFRRVGSMLVRLGLVSTIDGAVLAGYATSYALWLKASRELEQDGRLVIAAPNGATYRNPLLAIIETTGSAMRRFGEAMGLSAASRTRTPAVPVAPITVAGSAAEKRFFGDG